MGRSYCFYELYHGKRTFKRYVFEYVIPFNEFAVEEDYNKNKHDYYALLLKKYFQESYKKFSRDPEYLYFAGHIACIFPWYCDLELDVPDKMIAQAALLHSYNLIYQWPYYDQISITNPKSEALLEYIKVVLDSHSIIHTELQSKGSLGECILRMMVY